MPEPRALNAWLARGWGAISIAVVVALFALRACATTAPLDRLAPAPAEPGDPPGSSARAGALWIARGGPVIACYLGDAPARLVVDGHELGRCGAPQNRIVVRRGAVAIRFAAPPGARLAWSPVGRRGDVEYVPASSLSPEPPARATFGDDVGANRLDGAIALALLVTIVATACAVARRRLRRVPRATWLAMAAVFVVACGVRWIDLGGFGQAWDEDVNWAAGRNYITNLLALDFAPASWQWNYEHPPVMKYLVGIGAQLADGFGPARALSAIWMALACALLVPIGARLYRLRVGALAGAIAALLPPLVAHGQIVGHESPTALWWTLAIALALGVHDDLDRAPRPARALARRIAAVGVVVGVAAGSRFVGGLVGLAAAAIVVVIAPAAWRRRTAVYAVTAMPAAALATFYALWPRLWAHPIAALQASLAKLSNKHGDEPFLGAVTDSPGAHYFVVYLVATLPVGVLVGALAWLARSLRERDRAALVVALWLVVPLGVIASPVRQDGVRYVIPCVVALALAGAAGWDWLASRVERRVKHAFAALAGMVAAYLIVVAVRVHPFYLDYFGEQVGGAGAVQARRWFETAWWGEGLASAIAYVNDHAAPGARVYRECIEPVKHLGWFREDLWAPMVVDPRAADWIVVYAPATRGCEVGDARLVFEVGVDGAVLARVYQR